MIGNGPGPAGLRIYAAIAAPSLPWNSSARPSDPSGRCSQLSADAAIGVDGATGASVVPCCDSGFMAIPAVAPPTDGPRRGSGVAPPPTGAAPGVWCRIDELKNVNAASP